MLKETIIKYFVKLNHSSLSLSSWALPYKYILNGSLFHRLFLFLPFSILFFSVRWLYSFYYYFVHDDVTYEAFPHNFHSTFLSCHIKHSLDWNLAIFPCFFSSSFRSFTSIVSLTSTDGLYGTSVLYSKSIGKYIEIEGLGN